MYLSRLEVNPRRRETMRALASPQIIHAALEAAFPARQTEPSERTRTILWRTDHLKGALYLLVQSDRRPDFTHMVEQFGWPAADQRWDTRDYGPFLDKLAQDQQWRFRLRANPVRSLSDAVKDGRRGEVKAHVTAEQQRKWLQDKSGTLGFSLREVEVTDRETVRFRRSAQWITLARATFEGTLTVVDAARLAEAMRLGIGRAKAYGCGLLTLAGM